MPRRRVGLIGHGRIGRAVANAVVAGLAGPWDLAAVLTRHPAKPLSTPHYCDPASFLAVQVDLYIECAGPAALSALGAQALQRADVWSVSGVALCDDSLRQRLEVVGAHFGHRLRLVAGAAGGLDAVQAMAVDPEVSVDVAIVTPERREPFSSTVREAAAVSSFSVGLTLVVVVFVEKVLGLKIQRF